MSSCFTSNGGMKPSRSSFIASSYTARSSWHISYSHKETEKVPRANGAVRRTWHCSSSVSMWNDTLIRLSTWFLADPSLRREKSSDSDAWRSPRKMNGKGTLWSTTQVVANGSWIRRMEKGIDFCLILVVKQLSLMIKLFVFCNTALAKPITRRNRRKDRF